MNKLEQIESAFVYHAPKGDQTARYEQIRSMAKHVAFNLIQHCPDSRERSLALTHLQECIMWANAAIAINE